MKSKIESKKVNMIDVKELRLGNKFLSCFGNIETVKSIIDNEPEGGFAHDNERKAYSHLILCHENKNQYKPIEISPVILSESLLIDSGFENWGYDLLFWKIDIDGGIFEICGADRLGGFFVWNWHEDSTKDTHHQIEVNSLHQLQNIILDLSGKELPIKK